MDFPTVLVVDFGAQYAQLIARRIREAGDVEQEMLQHRLPVRGVPHLGMELDLSLIHI